jgi:hypothetical protein
MPDLDEICYSRQKCIDAIHDYYHFLTSMYLEESALIQPLENGWLTITAESMYGLDKSNEVIELLCRLPYIKIGYWNDP